MGVDGGAAGDGIRRAAGDRMAAGRRSAPASSGAGHAGDVAFVGRTFATALFKFTVLTTILGATLSIGLVALRYTGSPLAAVGVPLACLLSACLYGTAAVASGFRRYDVARHTPV